VAGVLASERVDRKKVAVVGAGAVGLYYGARLLEAGHDVSFIARTELEHLQRNGLTVESVDGNMRFDSIKVFGTAEEIGKVDWVVMALKTYALSAAPDLIRPLVGANTNILPIMNGFGIEDTLAKSFDSAFIFGGMAFVCINRVDGICKHLKYGALQVGHAHDEPAKLALVEELFAGTKVKLTTVPCLRMARWETLKLKLPTPSFYLNLNQCC
jgi:2-dehydropantoate 2-reductase